MNRLDFLIDWYHKENERHSNLNNSLSIPIGILTGLFALFFFLVKEFSFKSESHFYIKLLFVSFLILACICWLLVVFNLFCSYNNLFKGYEYKGLPYPTILNEQYENLEKFVSENKDELDSDDTAQNFYESQLIEMLSDDLNRNLANNDIKSRYLHIAKKYLLGCIIAVIVSAVPFMVNYIQNGKEDKIYNIDVKNAKDFSLRKEYDVTIKNSKDFKQDRQAVTIENIDKLNNKIKSVEVESLKINNYERQKEANTTTSTSTEVN
jgi:hypothetical protein